MRKYSKYIIALICLSIVIARLIYPALNFDLISLALIAIATFALLLTNPEGLLDKAKRIKLGGFELELQELNKEAKKIEEKIVHRKQAGLSGPVVEKSDEKEYSIEIIRLSSSIEKKLREIFESKFTVTSERPFSILELIEQLRVANYIDSQTFYLIKSFWEMRNKVMHNHKYFINEKDFQTFSDIGERIIKILDVIQSNLDKKLSHYVLD